MKNKQQIKSFGSVACYKVFKFKNKEWTRRLAFIAEQNIFSLRYYIKTYQNKRRKRIIREQFSTYNTN